MTIKEETKTIVDCLLHELSRVQSADIKNSHPKIRADFAYFYCNLETVRSHTRSSLRKHTGESAIPEMPKYINNHYDYNFEENIFYQFNHYTAYSMTKNVLKCSDI